MSLLPQVMNILKHSLQVSVATCATLIMRVGELKEINPLYFHKQRAQVEDRNWQTCIW